MGFHGFGCCCCRNVYAFGRSRQYNIKNIRTAQEKYYFVSNGDSFGDFDPKQKISFNPIEDSSSPPTTLLIDKYNESTKTYSNLVPSFTGKWASLSCDTKGQRLFYYFIGDGAPGYRIRRVNYDGSGDVQIYTGTHATIDVASHAVYNYESDKLFFVVMGDSTDPTSVGIYSIDGDGSNFTQIYATAAVPDIFSGGSIRYLEVDYINQRLWWSETAYDSFPGTFYYRVKSCSLDGSNVVEWQKSPPGTNKGWCVGIQTSYRHSCLFVYLVNSSTAQASDTTGGLYKMNFSWQQQGPQILSRSQADITLYDFRIGCGFEKTGTSSRG